MEDELNDAFREEIREHGSIEVAYGRLISNKSYRLLDGREYGNEGKFIRNMPRGNGQTPEETDDVIYI